MLMWIGAWIDYNQHVESVGAVFILKLRRVISPAISVAKGQITVSVIPKTTV